MIHAPASSQYFGVKLQVGPAARATPDCPAAWEPSLLFCPWVFEKIYTPGCVRKHWRRVNHSDYCRDIEHRVNYCPPTYVSFFYTLKTFSHTSYQDIAILFRNGQCQLNRLALVKSNVIFLNWSIAWHWGRTVRSDLSRQTQSGAGQRAGLRNARTVDG